MVHPRRDTSSCTPATPRRSSPAGTRSAATAGSTRTISELDAAEQRAIQDRSIEAVVRFTGLRPRGHRAPYWAFSEDTIGVLEDAGFAYDSSLMADDYRPYRVRRGDRHSTTEGTTFGPESKLIEVPVYWTLDDWPLFEPGPDNGRDGMRPPSAGARDLVARAPLRPRARARRPADRHDASRVHRPRPPHGDGRAVHRRGEGPRRRGLRAPRHVPRALGRHPPSCRRSRSRDGARHRASGASAGP